MSLAERFADAACGFEGTPFRLHGRIPATGLDCVGLVAASLATVGLRPRAPSGYSLRNVGIEAHLAFAGANGFRPAGGILARGDLLLVNPGRAQHHLVIACGFDEFVHAHASLGRVVRHPGPLHWPVTKHWRLLPPNKD